MAMQLRALVAAGRLLSRCQRNCQYFVTEAAPENDSILSAYARLVDGGSLQPDRSQIAAVQALHLLQRALVARTTDGPSTAAASQQARGSGSASDTEAQAGGGGAPAVQGAYLWGSVGSGKTMLMDLFARTLPAGLETRRFHIHGLLAHVHERGHQLQQALPRIVIKSRLGLPVYRYALPEEDPLRVISRELAASCHLLCIDELHVADVADALTLGRLFEALIEGGCWVAFTVSFGATGRPTICTREAPTASTFRAASCGCATRTFCK